MGKVTYLTELEQGSKEWVNLRKDKLTGTTAYSLLKGKTPAEIIKQKNSAQPFFGNYWTDRGHLLENEARLLYSDLNHVEAYEVGAILNSDYQNCLSSPDGLIGDNGGLEIKSFAQKHHLALFNKIDPSIIAQIQWNLFLSEREYWDFVAYNPEMTDLDQVYFQKRIYPDPDTFTVFKKALSNF